MKHRVGCRIRTDTRAREQNTRGNPRARARLLLHNRRARRVGNAMPVGNRPRIHAAPARTETTRRECRCRRAVSRRTAGTGASDRRGYGDADDGRGLLRASRQPWRQRRAINARCRRHARLVVSGCARYWRAATRVPARADTLPRVVLRVAPRGGGRGGGGPRAAATACARAAAQGGSRGCGQIVSAVVFWPVVSARPWQAPPPWSPARGSGSAPSTGGRARDHA
jgi:hypothetical protein